ncbi:MAG: hypothetical protein AAF125_05235 [Chloroflexota bacterium]
MEHRGFLELTTNPTRCISTRVRCKWWCGFSGEVETFIRHHKLPQCHICVIKPHINRLAGGVERLYRHLPELTPDDLTPPMVEALLVNQAGHLDITLRHYFRMLRYGTEDQCDRSRAGLQRQLRLARYRFLNYPDHPELAFALYIELEALRQHPICWDLRQTLHKTLMLLDQREQPHD